MLADAVTHGMFERAPQDKWQGPFSGLSMVAWLVLAFSAAITLWAWRFVSGEVSDAARTRFEREVTGIQQAVADRLRLYENSLRGAQGLFAATKAVDRATWRSYVEKLDLDNRYPGIQGMGFSLRIPVSARRRHVESVRAEGFPEYAISPATERDEYHSIIYLEPFRDRNLRAFGYDMSTEPVRRAAMERARDTGLPAVSGKVILVQETTERVQAGFLMYLPVYREGSAATTVAQRRDALLGYVYSPFRMDDLMEGIQWRQRDKVGFRIFDGSNTSPDLLLYDRISGLSPETFRPVFAADRSLAFGGRTWTFQFSTLPAFRTLVDRREPLAVLLVGSAISLLLFGITWSFAHARARAVSLARAMTAELSESQARHRAVTETASDAIISADDQGHIIHFNRSAERIFGYPANEMLGRPLTLLMPARYQQAHRAGLLRFLGTGQPKIIGRTLELQATRKDGTEFPMEISVASWTSGKRVFFTAILRDITVRKQAEEALKKLNEELEMRVRERTAELNAALEDLRSSERRYRMLFEANPHPMWVYDVKTLEYLAANDAATQHYGYTKEEFARMTLLELRPPEQHENIRGLVRRLKPGPRRGVYRHLKKNGELIDVEVVSDSIEFAGRDARLVLANDVTERKRAEEEVRRLNAELERRVEQRTAQLEAANRELEAFSYSVSHDLRAPLRHVDGFAELLNEECGQTLDEAGKRYLAIISDSVRLMGQLIDDLLAFSKIGRVELRYAEVSMSELVDEVIARLRDQAKDRRIKWEIQPLPAVRGDRSMLKQVWVNLLSNAVKYTRQRRLAEIRVGCVNKEGELEFYVEDNGAGFDMEYAGKLFGVFQRLHRAEDFEGSGVGLANVRRIVARHGGKTRAQGEVDRGSTFYFTLPVASGAGA